MKTYKDNKWLIVNAQVVMCPIPEKVIISLDTLFEQFHLRAAVTSVFRDAVNQLDTIRKYLKKQGLSEKYADAMNCKVTDMKGTNYVWQEAWSALLNSGIIINPALEARCLMHTTFDSRDRFNQLIHQTPHARKMCFDIGGAENGVEDEARVIQAAIDQHHPGIVGMTVEHGNNCVHVDCKAF